MRKDLRLGGLVGIYILIKNNSAMVGDEIKRVIVEELFSTIAEFENQELVYMISALEIISLIGPTERSFQRMGVIKAIMCEPSQRKLQ